MTTAITSITAEKVDQAIRILDELEIDAWLTFVRETSVTDDPVLPLILGQPLTWPSALILTRSGKRIAIVGKYEDEAVRLSGVWHEVVPYVQSVREPLLDTLKRLDPKQIAVNYSTDLIPADGLSHGMFLLLQRYLSDAALANRLISAEDIVRGVRSRKTPAEVDRMRHAIRITDEIFETVAEHVHPGHSEQEISRFMHDEAARRGVGLAWESAHCPIVTTGSDSMVGHGLPSPDLVVRVGNVFHLDFGVRYHGYCSDIQRAWYVPLEGELEAPAEVHRAFDAVVHAIKAAAEVLRPGVTGWKVDEAARSTFVSYGYEEYQHATGHQIGLAAHDGGCLLGPRWERYGRTPEYEVEAGNVFTLELGVENADGRGYLGLEEMVLVTEAGCEFMTHREATMPLLR